MLTRTLVRILPLTSALLAAASPAHAAYEEEVAEQTYDAPPPPPMDVCDVYVKKGDPIPEMQSGQVVCIIAPAPPPDTSSGYTYAANVYHHEANVMPLCTSAANNAPPPANPTPWQVRWSYGEKKGDSRFKAGVVANATLRAEPKDADSEDRLEAYASLRATATLFSVTKDVAKIEIDADAEYGRQAHGHYKVSVLGVTLKNETKSTPLSMSARSNREFIGASLPFSIGPVPVYVSGSVNGEIGVTGTTGPVVGTTGTAVGVKVEGEPYARLYAEASVGVGVEGVLAAGVQGELTLLETGVPSNAVATFKPRSDGAMDIGWSLNSDIELRTLAGKLKGFVTIIWTLRETLAEWSGLTKTTPLFHLTGCKSLLSPGT